MFALRHVTSFDHGGGEVCEETEGQLGSPERLMLVTSQLRATAALQMREPRKPLPPQTTSFFFAAAVEAMICAILALKSAARRYEGWWKKRHSVGLQMKEPK